MDHNYLLFQELQIDLTNTFEVVRKNVADACWQAFEAKCSPNFDADGALGGAVIYLKSVLPSVGGAAEVGASCQSRAVRHSSLSLRSGLKTVSLPR